MLQKTTEHETAFRNTTSMFQTNKNAANKLQPLIIIIIIITDLYSAFRSEDTEALGAAQED